MHDHIFAVGDWVYITGLIDQPPCQISAIHNSGVWCELKGCTGDFPTSILRLAYTAKNAVPIPDDTLRCGPSDGDLVEDWFDQVQNAPPG